MQPVFSPYFLSEDDMVELVEAVEHQGEVDWELFLSYAQRIEVAAGDVVIQQFDVEPAVFVLTEGEMEVLVAPAADAAPTTVAAVRPVAIIGEQTFLDGKPRSATVRAKTASVVHRLRLSDFDRLRSQEPEIACAFLFDVARSLSLRQRQLQGKRAG